MLIVCPTCATSYMIDPASVGAAGRAVRCARCRATWFVSPSKPADPPSVSAFVDSVIAEAEANEKTSGNAASPPQPPSFEPPPGIASDAPHERFPRGAPTAFDALPPRAEPPAEPPLSDFDTGRRNLPAEPDFATEPVTINDAPPITPPQEPLFAPPGDNDFFRDPPPHAGEDDGENFAARRARMKTKRKVKSNRSRWTAVILVLLAVNAALIGARSEVVRYLPQTASLFSAIGLPVNLRNLEFEGINIAKETQDGVSILIIEGRIVNTTGKAVDVPRLRFAARNVSGQEIYTWTMQPPRSVLGPGDSLPFTSRLAAPPADAADILVRFFNIQDAGRGPK